MTEQEIKQIIKENKETLAKIDQRIHRIEKRFVWDSVFSFIKILVILAPIVLGIIYLTPFLKDFVRIYEPMLKNLPLTLQNFNNSSSGDKTSGQIEQGLDTFCDPQARQAMVDSLCK